MADNNATITQSLSSITQSTEGYQLFNAQLHDIGIAAAYPFEGYAATLVSTGLGSSAMSGLVAQLHTSTADADSELTFEVVINMHESATASDSMDGSSYTTTFTHTAKASSEITSSITWNESSSATATSSMETAINTSLSSTALASSTIDPGIVYNQLLTSHAHASSEMVTGQYELVVNTANASDSQTYYNAVTETLESVADTTDTWTPWASATELLTNTATGNSTWSFEGSVYNNILVSTAKASDWMWAKDFGAIAWVLNTQSGGLTNYNNFGFTSIAFHSGVLYATSPEGVFKLNTDDDAGRNIAAHIKSGFDDFGTENKKRISDIFVGCTGSDMECEVETFDKQAYTYPMEYRDVDTPYNNRIKTGRGLSSRWWRLTLRNTNGADFQIHDVAVQLGTSKRRL